MFLFRRRNKNKIELERFIFHKTENIYRRNTYEYPETRKKKFAIHTAIKNVPVVIEKGRLTAKVRYTGIPDIIVYFVLNISNIQNGYISSSNTIDIIVNAAIKGEECKDFKFELSPIYERRAISCGQY